MKITIITPTYNSAAYLDDCLRSVAVQSYKNIEHIIIDGGSTDTTLEVIKRYPHIAHVVSERDAGIYDAMNKGITLASGDVIGILNSDDLLVGPDIIQSVVDCLNTSHADACYGDITYVKRDNPSQVVRHWRAGAFHQRKLRMGWIPPHPSFFAKKDLYARLGCFNTSFRIAADYELMLRFLVKGSSLFSYLPRTVVYMREGGYSGKNIIQRWRGWQELLLAWRVNGLTPPLYILPVRILLKVHQYFFVFLKKRIR